MTPLGRRLADYAAYHRDGRNVATHMIGIPLIVLAVAILLSRAGVHVEGAKITGAMILSAASVIFYLRLDLVFGAVMAVLLALACWAGLAVAGLPTAAWAGIGIGMFVVGWVFQLVGHVYEGRKPAFLDDVAGLIVGPLFIVAEIAFALGMRRELRAVVETPRA
jgi:uncharacterized membrane protein YGL010W